MESPTATWGEFEEAAPELAALGRRRLEATHVALLGTLRIDGSPRISPIEPYLVGSRLLLGMLPASQKARDLGRDPRCTLHSSVSDVNGTEGEFKLYGHVDRITDAALLRGYQAWWTADDASPAAVFALQIATAAHVSWDMERGNMTVMRWQVDSGVTAETQPY